MQSYKNHMRLSPMFHGVLYICLIGYIIGAIINLRRHWIGDEGHLQAALLLGVGVIFFLLTYFIRSFPLQAQDRVIRAEENMRHYVLTGKLLDTELTMSQIIALRFASDAEFPALAHRATQENLSSKAIKEAVQSWRADNHRM